jgi:hypothetical protein
MNEWAYFIQSVLSIPFSWGYESAPLDNRLITFLGNVLSSSAAAEMSKQNGYASACIYNLGSIEIPFHLKGHHDHNLMKLVSTH